jgi:hypothetical protein
MSYKVYAQMITKRGKIPQLFTPRQGKAKSKLENRRKGTKTILYSIEIGFKNQTVNNFLKMLLSRIGRTKSDKVKFAEVHLVAPYQNSVTHWNANPFSYFICKSHADNIGRLAI